RCPGDRQPEEEHVAMNNLYRELAPISDAAWADIEQEARRTFEQHVAARRVVDLAGPDGPALAGVNTGHLTEVDAPADGVIAHLRAAQPLVRLRSEEHTSELQSRRDLVCRLLLEKKKKKTKN